MKVGNIKVQTYGQELKTGVNPRGRQYSFHATEVQVLGDTAGGAPVVGQMSFDDALAPGVYEVPVFLRLGRFNRVTPVFGKPVAVKK